MDIRVEHLRKSYDGQPVLKDISFTVGGDCITCVMAPSGRGKTTLLRMLLGLERPDGGKLLLPRGCRWAAVFQEDRLLELLDALGNLHFALGRDYAERPALELLEQLGLSPEPGKPVREYSGGMKRRLALARALLAPSDALVLDEPFTGLDEENRARAITCIRRMTAGKPVLLVTHDLSDAEGLNARIIRL